MNSEYGSLCMTVFLAQFTVLLVFTAFTVYACIIGLRLQMAGFSKTNRNHIMKTSVMCLSSCVCDQAVEHAVNEHKRAPAAEEDPRGSGVGSIS